MANEKRSDRSVHAETSSATLERARTLTPATLLTAGEQRDLDDEIRKIVDARRIAEAESHKISLA